MTQFNSKILYERLLQFAKLCQKLVGKLPKTVYNLEYGRQLVRSSASPGSNYIEAIEASSRRDFIHRLKICRKEVKESIHWLRLIQFANEEVDGIRIEADQLINDAQEFIRIFTSSILTAEKNREIKK